MRASLMVLVCSGCTMESVLLDLPEQDGTAHDCSIGSELDLELLDDFETASRADFSYYANPEDPTGYTRVEPPGSDPNMTALTEVNRCRGTEHESLYALHLVGGGYSSYGPNLGWTIGQTSSQRLDLSDHDGVSFWASTDASTPQTLQIVLNDVYTFPVADEEARRCTLAEDGVAAAPGTGCWNGGRSARTLSRSWRLYTVDFYELTQQTWGFQSPGGRPDLSAVMSLEFHFPTEDAFDVWIDEIKLFRR